MVIHEYLAIIETADGRKVIVCRRCGHEFCEASDNYKKFALLRERNLSDLPRRYTLSGEPAFIVYQEFICPGCGTLLQVDPFCRDLDAGEPLVWDIQVDV